MSAAASRHELESSAAKEKLSLQEGPGDEQERHKLEDLTDIHPAIVARPIIAIDLDDVLSQTNQAVADWHNDIYQTNMSISDFYYYYYWKNPFWGTLEETFAKVRDFYSTDYIYRAQPVQGALEGLRALQGMGYKLIIVTARAQDHADESWVWVSKHFPGMFDSIICTGQFSDAHKTGHEVVTKLSKAQVCADLGAKFLIDDSAENALQCANSEPTIPVLLFGDYEWNKRVSGADDAKDEMAFDRRFRRLGGKEFWKEEVLLIPDGAHIYRVKDWAEVVQWIGDARRNGSI